MEQRTSVATTDSGGQKISVKNIAAGSIGHVMEWFDYAVYAYAAPIIAVLFFPSTNPVTSLLATFAVFAVGFASRPLGALVLGPLGDRIGSTKVLSLSVVIMAIATAFMGVLPTYDQIGIWAPILLVAARLVQGFSVGAEIGSATTFLVEIAPARRRGFYGSWTHQSTAVGMLLASVAFTLLSLNLSDSALESWGWRVPFLFSIALAFFGFYLRRKLPNTPKFEEVLEEGSVTDSSYKEIFVDRYKTMLRVVGIIASFTIGFYFIFSYLPSYTSAFVESSFASAFGANAFGLIFFASILPFLGMLSDRIGRKPLMLIGYAGFVVMSYPLLTLMNTGTFAAVVTAQLGFVLMLALIAAPLQTALAEIFPTRIRNSSLSISYNIAIALLGGTAPLVATYLSSIADDNRLFLALYLGVAGVISFLTMLGIKDRYRDDLV